MGAFELSTGRVILTSGMAPAAEKARELCDRGPREKLYHPQQVLNRRKILFEKRRVQAKGLNESLEHKCSGLTPAWVRRSRSSVWPSARLKVLIVEAEPTLRMLTADQIRIKGLRVIEAAIAGHGSGRACGCSRSAMFSYLARLVDSPLPSRRGRLTQHARDPGFG